MGWRGPVESIVKRTVEPAPAETDGWGVDGVVEPGGLPPPPPHAATARLAQAAPNRASGLMPRP